MAPLSVAKADSAIKYIEFHVGLMYHLHEHVNVHVQCTLCMYKTMNHQLRVHANLLHVPIHSNSHCT